MFYRFTYKFDISDLGESDYWSGLFGSVAVLEQARRATVLVQYYALNISEDEILEAHGLGITTASFSDL